MQLALKAKAQVTFDLLGGIERRRLSLENSEKPIILNLTSLFCFDTSGAKDLESVGMMDSKTD